MISVHSQLFPACARLRAAGSLDHGGFPLKIEPVWKGKRGRDRRGRGNETMERSTTGAKVEGIGGKREKKREMRGIRRVPRGKPLFGAFRSLFYF